MLSTLFAFLFTAALILFSTLALITVLTTIISALLEPANSRRYSKPKHTSSTHPHLFAGFDGGASHAHSDAGCHHSHSDGGSCGHSDGGGSSGSDGGGGGDGGGCGDGGGG